MKQHRFGDYLVLKVKGSSFRGVIVLIVHIDCQDCMFSHKSVSGQSMTMIMHVLYSPSAVLSKAQH